MSSAAASRGFAQLLSVRRALHRQLLRKTDPVGALS
jgi:hypothetical protein